MKRSAATFVATLLLTALLLPVSAAADSHSIVTAGVGTALGVTQSTSASGAQSASFSSELSLRLKALYVLGLDLAYSPTDATSTRDLVYTNDLRLSLLLYVVPTPVVSAYAKAGIEADSLGGLFAVDDPSNAYHVGGGLDVSVTDGISIGLEFLWLIPGATSVESHVKDYVRGEQARVEAALSAGQAPPTDIGADAPNPSDFLSASNFRLTVGARYYF